LSRPLPSTDQGFKVAARTIDESTTNKLRNLTSIAVLLLAVLPTILPAQDQLNVKFGIKAGYEFANYASSQSESFKKFPGSTIGIFSVLSSASNSRATVVLCFELNYVKLLYYANDQRFLFNAYTPNDNADILYSGNFDEEFRYEFIEFCFPVEIYPAFFERSMPVGFYFGPSIGIGSEILELKEKSRSFVDTLTVYSYNFDDQSNPYSYPSSGGFRTPVSLNVGLALFYRFVTIDLRYKYTFNISNSNNNLFLQIGLAY
jgi:hypothetical protein